MVDDCFHLRVHVWRFPSCQNFSLLGQNLPALHGVYHIDRLCATPIRRKQHHLNSNLSFKNALEVVRWWTSSPNRLFLQVCKCTVNFTQKQEKRKLELWVFMSSIAWIQDNLLSYSMIFWRWVYSMMLHMNIVSSEVFEWALFLLVQLHIMRMVSVSNILRMEFLSRLASSTLV